MDGSRVNVGLLIALFGVAGMWVYMFRTYIGFQLQVGGLAPHAAKIRWLLVVPGLVDR